MKTVAPRPAGAPCNSTACTTIGFGSSKGAAARCGAGEAIVVTGVFRLTDGQPVRVLDVPQPVMKIGD